MTRSSSKTITIYTDGACKGNPGLGGWGALLLYKGKERELHGWEKDTTNNRMELTAVIEALRALKSPCTIELYTDSQYVKNGITQWSANWQKNNWKTSDNKPVKNSDLWKTLIAEISTHHVQWHWVKGHAGNPGNERADGLANKAIAAALEQMK